jgi:hypothetical protein
MSDEVRISVRVRLPDEPTGTALPAKTVLLAWEAFTAAIKGTDVIANDFYLGPADPPPIRMRYRRVRRPRLVTTEPPSAA